jgi:hypothetical protein
MVEGVFVEIKMEHRIKTANHCVLRYVQTDDLVDKVGNQIPAVSPEY